MGLDPTRHRRRQSSPSRPRERRGNGSISAARSAGGAQLQSISQIRIVCLLFARVPAPGIPRAHLLRPGGDLSGAAGRGRSGPRIEAGPNHQLRSRRLDPARAVARGAARRVPGRCRGRHLLRGTDGNYGRVLPERRRDTAAGAGAQRARSIRTAAGGRCKLCADGCNVRAGCRAGDAAADLGLHWIVLQRARVGREQLSPRPPSPREYRRRVSARKLAPALLVRSLRRVPTPAG